MNLEHLFIAAVVIGAALALLYVAIKGMGVPVPDWVMKFLWIIVIAVAAVMAIRFVFSL